MWVVGVPTGGRRRLTAASASRAGGDEATRRSPRGRPRAGRGRRRPAKPGTLAGPYRSHVIESAIPSQPAAPVTGLAHVATVSFLAGRITPAGAFWVSLAGGVALARIGARTGVRGGYGASIAAMTETVAVMGPARLSGPVTQALSAPLLGAMHAAGRGFAALFAACLAIRLTHYVVLAAFVLTVVVGGIDAYVDSYDRIIELTGDLLPSGTLAALGLAVLANLAGALLFTTVQVSVYRRALREEETVPPEAAQRRAPEAARAGWALRGLATAVVVAWVVMLAIPSWAVLGVIAAAVAAGVVAARATRSRAMRFGVVLGLALAVGALVPAALGAVELDDAARRAVRAVLLVTSAALVQAIAGADGVRNLAAGALHRVRRLPAVAEAAALAPALRADRRVVPASLELVGRVREAAPSPRELSAAVVVWVGDEARRGP